MARSLAATGKTPSDGFIRNASAVTAHPVPAGQRSPVHRGRAPGVDAGRRSDEIASLLVYLCSEQAGYITGNWIEADGGHHRSAF